MTQPTVHVNSIPISNEHPFVLFGGMNVLESEDLALHIAEKYVEVTQALEIPLIFKASYDKANRSSIHSFRGPGMEKGMEIFQKIKNRFNVPIITDIHEPFQAKPVAEVVDILQIPAFLSRQTDLIQAATATGKPINIKKAQFLAPEEMRHILEKCRESGNDNLILCERGTSFGYGNLVVDMLGFSIMKSFQVPVIFDVTHALQKPGGKSHSADGRRQMVQQLALAGMSQSIAGLFLESHPNPDEALCDGPCALPLDLLKPFLKQLKAIDELVKNMPKLNVG